MLPMLWKQGEFLPMFSLRPGVDRLFEDFFEEKSLAPFWTNGKALPPMDVKETDEAVIVEAELPGLQQKEIEVKIENGVLSILAERKEEKNEKTKTVHRMERHYGRMERKLALPETVEGEKVEATYKDGVLRITLPKKPAAKAKSVSVNVK